MSKTLKAVIGAANQGKAYSIMPLVREAPELAAMLTKLIPGREPPRYNDHGEMKPGEPNIHEMRNLGHRTGQSITDAETVMEMLPETELALQILISCILSPKDMMTTELTYAAPDTAALPPDVANALVSRLRQYFENDYKIIQILPQILKDVLGRTGSYAVAVIPENAIDEVINNNRAIKMEHLSSEINSDGSMRSRGLLRNPDNEAARAVADGLRGKRSVAAETLNNYSPSKDYDPRLTLAAEFKGIAQETYTSVTDNFTLLKVPQINQKIREQRVTRALGGVALENAFPEMHEYSDRELHSMLYKSPKRQYRPIDSLVTQERLNRRTVGSPLVMHLPSESVIPVYVPGNVKQQVGFFVLIDQDGNPLTRPSEEDVYGQMASRMTNASGQFATAMLNKAKYNADGFDIHNRDHLNYSAHVYGAMIEQDLLSRLRNGVYANGVALANKPEVYRIMLARALAAQHTQLLFLPSELMTYFAFNYTASGVGRSILDEMKILSSMRAMLTFADTMAAMKNSIGRTNVAIKLDEADPDPQKTIERYMHMITKTRQMSFPIGASSPVDITDYLERAGFEFTFQGHPRIPDTSVEFTEKNSSYTRVDTDLRDDLRKRSIQKFGLPAQVVDNGFEAEFATAVVTNNILISKNAMQHQDKLHPLLDDHARKVAMNDEGLVKDLRKILEDNYDRLVKRIDAIEAEKIRQDGSAATSPQQAAGLVAQREEEAARAVREQRRRQVIIKDLLDEFVLGFSITLPRPNSVSLDNQKASFDKYMEVVDAALTHYISTDILNSETLGDLSEHVDSIKNNIKAVYARRWMAENGMLPELAELTTLDEEGMPAVNLMEQQSDHIKAIATSMNRLLEQLKATKTAANKIEQARKDADTGEGGADTTSSESSSSSSSSDDDGGGDGGGDDFGMGGDDGFGDVGGDGDGSGDVGEGSGDENDDAGGGDGSSDTGTDGANA